MICNQIHNLVVLAHLYTEGTTRYLCREEPSDRSAAIPRLAPTSRHSRLIAVLPNIL